MRTYSLVNWNGQLQGCRGHIILEVDAHTRQQAWRKIRESLDWTPGTPFPRGFRDRGQIKLMTRLQLERFNRATCDYISN